MNIALIGMAGSGKDTLYEHASKKYGYTRYAFADKVKEVAKKYYPDLYGEITEKNRWLLQKVATMFREIDADVWIKAMFKVMDRVSKIRSGYGEMQENIVITDCRMPNEYEALKNRGYIFIRIDVDEEICKQRLLDRGDIFNNKDMKHHTESFYDTFNCDYTIENNGTLQEMYRSFDDVMELIMQKGEI